MRIVIDRKNINNKSLLGKDKLNNPATLNSAWFNKKTESNEILLNDLVALIENNTLLNYPSNFLSLDGSNSIAPNVITINLVDNHNFNQNQDAFEHYDRNTGQITITEKLLHNNQLLPNNFAEHLYAAIGQSKLLNYAVLHEIGHAIHHQLYLKQNKNYLIPPQEFEENTLLNLIVNNGVYLLGKNKESDKYDINHSITYAIKEGFADLYACIGITKVYTKEVAESFINEVIDARKTNYDYYYVVESLEQLKIDNKQNKLNFSNFDSLHTYINDTIANTAFKKMLEKLDSKNIKQIPHNNTFAGFLKALLENNYNIRDLNNVNSTKELIDYLELKNNKFNIALQDTVEDKDMFILGYNNTLSINTTRQNFLSSKMKLYNSSNIQEKISNIRKDSLSSQHKRTLIT